jgi:serine/threonine-protein kinase SRPK3
MERSLGVAMGSGEVDKERGVNTIKRQDSRFMSMENAVDLLNIRVRKATNQLNQLDISGLGSVLDGAYDEDATPIREQIWPREEDKISIKDHQPSNKPVGNFRNETNALATDAPEEEETVEEETPKEESMTDTEKQAAHNSSGHDEAVISPTEEQWEPVDPFIYEENINDYLHGGFYPVEIGDKVISRYEVIHKLGNGGHGTVWLVYDLERLKWRALKILSAPQSGEDGPDRRFLRLMRDKDISTEDLEKRRIVFPCEDPFEIDNPDGRKNLCLVMPLMGPDLISIRQWAPAMMRRIFYELAESLEFLHQRNICHGDFRPSNLLLCLDQEDLHTISKEEMKSILEKPNTQEIDHAIWWEHYPQLPRYIVQKADTSWLGIKFTGQAAVVDFGCAYDVVNSYAYAGIPPMWAAPEAYWNLKSGLPGDVWALATTIAQVYAGTDMFYGHQHDDAVVAEYEFVLGSLPEPFRTAHREQLKRAKLYESSKNSGSGTVEQLQSSCDIADKPVAAEDTHSFDAKYPSEPISMPLEALSEERKDYCDKHGQPTIIRALISRPWLMEMRDPEFPYHEHNADNHYDLLRAYPDITIERRLVPQEVEVLGDLLEGILRYRPEARFRISDVLHHEWFGYEEERRASFEDDVVDSMHEKDDKASKRHGQGRDTENRSSQNEPWAERGRARRRKYLGKRTKHEVQASKSSKSVVSNIITIDNLLCTNIALLSGIVLATVLWLPMAAAFYIIERQHQRQAMLVNISFHRGSL